MSSNCIGWWQQAGFGRQPMNDLLLRFDGNVIDGSGVDVIASFRMSGRVRADGSVEILKKYHDRHTVLYVGQYDGEGTLYGNWDIGGYQGKWSIRLKHPIAGHAGEIQEIAPRPSP